MNMIPLQKIIQEEKGENWTLEEVYHFASYPGMKVMEELEVNNPEEVYARWVKYVNEYQASPYEGMDDVLKTLHEKLRFSVVSSKNKKQYDIDVVSLLFILEMLIQIFLLQEMQALILRLQNGVV